MNNQEEEDELSTMKKDIMAYTEKLGELNEKIAKITQLASKKKNPWLGGIVL